MFFTCRADRPRQSKAPDRVSSMAACVLLVISANLLAQSSGSMSISDDVPAGFESLIEAQTIVVDIHYNERKVGNTLVTADAETLTFEDPAAVVDMLEGIEDPTRLTGLLQEVLPTNGHLVCYASDDPPGCGQIDPDPLAIIYDADLLKLDLYLEQSLQSVQYAESARYLPEPENRKSSILSLNALATNTSDGREAVDLAARAFANYGTGTIFAEFDYNTRTERTRLETARLTHLFRNHSLSFGSYAFESGSALSNVDILGASFESSLRTRIDLDDAFSSELAVYLPRRSQVQMVVDDRVYVADTYPAGNQAINTVSLPNGTYEVEIRIYDPVSGLRSEFRLFTKSTSLPPRGETIFGLTFGIPVEFTDLNIIPELSDISLGGLNFARRFTDHSAWKLSLIGANTLALAEAEYILLGPKLSLQFNLSGGSEQLRAGTLRLGYTNARMSYSLSGSWFRAGDSLTDDPFLESIIPGPFTQYSASWTRTFGKSSLNARYNLRKVGRSSDNPRTTSDVNVSFRHLLFKSSTLRTTMDFNYQQDNSGRSLNLGFTISVDEPRGSTELGIDLARNVDNEDSGRINLSHSVRSDEKNPIQWETTFRSEIDEESEGLGLSSNIDHESFALKFNADWNTNGEDESTRNSSISLGTNIGIDSQGFAFGGVGVGQSGVIIQIKGLDDDTEFDIYINGLRSGESRAGETRFVGLEPLREYVIKLIPRSALTSTLSENTFRFTVYPGVVYRVNAEARVRVLLIATIIDERGEIVRDGFVNRDPNPVLVDSEGFIQAEVSPGEILTVVRTGLPNCTLVVPEVSGDEEFLILDDPLTCKVIQ